MSTCTPLKPGAVLRTMDGTEFRLLSENTEGGSAILYQAKQCGSALDVTLKEFCPPDAHRAGGVLLSRHAKDAALQREVCEQLKKRAAKEYDAGQSISNETLHALLTLRLLEVRSIQEPGGPLYENADGTPLPCVFFCMPTLNKSKGFFLQELLEECAAFPRSDAHPFGNRQDKEDEETTAPDVLTSLRIIKLLLEALQTIHKSWLHGDISLGNVFVDGDLHTGALRGVFLLDFGSARPLDVSGKTACIHSGQDLYTTNAFCAPEIDDFRQRGKALQLTAAADIYSVGHLLRLLLNGEALCAVREENELSLSIQMTDTDLGLLDVDGSARPVLDELNALLRAAAEKDPARRISGDSMLAQLNALIARLTAPTYQLMENLSSPEEFIPHSRDTEFELLQQSLDAQKRPVFLWGTGGLGKTETSRAFLLKCKKNGLRTAFFHYKDSVRNTILNLRFNGYTPPPFVGMTAEQKEEALYQAKLALLSAMGPDSVVVMDNFDSYSQSFDQLRSEPAYQDLISLAGPHLIITTRFKPPENGADIEIRPLRDDMLLKMMQKYAPDSPKETLLSIIHIVQGHSLTCFLIAKAINESLGDLTADAILQALKQHSLSEVPDEVSSDKDRAYTSATIYSHLKVLWDLSGMTGAYRSALCHTALLPLDGIDYKLFRQGETKEEQTALKKLITQGWISRTRVDKDVYLLTVHPLIKELIINELKPEESDYNGFLKLLQQPEFFSTSEQNSSALRKLDLAQSVLSFPDFSPTPELAAICCAVGFHSFKRGRRRESVPYYDRGIAIYKQLSSKDSQYLYQYASEIGSIGFLMSATSEYQKRSAELLRQSVSIWESLNYTSSGKFLKEYATACDNLGYQLSLSHDAILHHEAKKFLHLALSIRFRLYQKQPEYYARAYAWTADNLGKVLTRDEDAFSEAETLLRTALSIRQEINRATGGKNISEIAWTCHNLGQLLAAKPEYWAEAEKHYRTSIQLREELDQLNPGTHTADASWTMLKLADLLAQQPERRTETKNLYRKVLEIQSSIEKNHPGMFVLDVSQIRRRYADYLRGLKARTADEEKELTSLIL